MDAISNLVFNALAQYEGIRLPGIGSLSVVCIPALIDEKGDIVPPNNKVVYLKEEPENLTSIVDLIEHSAGSDTEKAEDLYKKWVDKMRDEEGVIVIERTGEIRQDIFTIYPELEAILNPASAGYAAAAPENSLSPPSAPAGQIFGEPVSPVPALAKAESAEKMMTKPIPAKQVPIKPASAKVKVNTNTVMILIVVGVLLGAAIVFGLLYMRGQKDKSYRLRSNVSAVTAVAPAKSAIPSVQPLADTVKQESASSVSAGVSADEALQVPQASQGQQTPASSSPQSGDSAASAVANTPASAQAKGHTAYYVVAGVFSVDQNADKFIVQSKAKGSTVQFAKIPWKGKVLVSAYTSSSRSDAEQMRRKLSSEFGELWVHEETER